MTECEKAPVTKRMVSPAMMRKWTSVFHSETCSPFVPHCDHWSLRKRPEWETVKKKATQQKCFRIRLLQAWSSSYSSFLGECKYSWKKLLQSKILYALISHMSLKKAAGGGRLFDEIELMRRYGFFSGGLLGFLLLFKVNDYGRSNKERRIRTDRNPYQKGKGKSSENFTPEDKQYEYHQ